jgi:hypothetical protein
MSEYQCLTLDYVNQCIYNTTSTGRAYGEDEPRWIEQRCVISHYRFYLAFENSRHNGYVTEKVWQALAMGAIPIYWGAPDVVGLLPDPDAIIDASSFDSLEALATYINFLMESPDAYQKHMQWREKPLAESFRRVFDKSVGAAACQLCDHIAYLKYNSN